MILLKTFLIFSCYQDNRLNYVVFDKDSNVWLSEFTSSRIEKVLVNLRKAVTKGFPERAVQKQDYQKTGVYHDGEIVMYISKYDYIGKFTAKPYKGNRWKSLEKYYKARNTE